MDKDLSEGVLASLIRKRDRVHPSNRRADLPMGIKLTFGDLQEIIDELSTRPSPVAGAGETKLPCDVRLPPATTVCAGVSLSTLLSAIEYRREAGVVHFPPALSAGKAG